MQTKNQIAVLISAYNEEKTIQKIVAECLRYIAHVIVVDDGSTDETAFTVSSLPITVLNNVVNAGKGAALRKGFRHVVAQSFSGVITMDADLQHPPALIPDMIARWREGAEVVYTTKRQANLPFVRELVERLFYRLLSRMSALELDFGLSDFRLADRKVVDVLLEMPEYHKFLRGQVKWRN